MAVKVRCTNPPGAAPQRSADGSTVYLFSGGAPVIVRNEEDIARFRIKAEKNPGLWIVEPLEVAERMKEALRPPPPKPPEGVVTTTNAPGVLKRS